MQMVCQLTEVLILNGAPDDRGQNSKYTHMSSYNQESPLYSTLIPGVRQEDMSNRPQNFLAYGKCIFGNSKKKSRRFLRNALKISRRFAAHIGALGSGNGSDITGVFGG